MKLAIVGCGDLGRRSAALLHGAGWQVLGLRRDPGRLPAEIEGIAADYTVAGGLNRLRELAPDYLLVTFTPAGPDIEGYRLGYERAASNLLEGLGEHRPRWTLLVSSTRVYAEHDGAWVDEDSPLSQSDPRARALVQMEQTLLQSALDVSAVRCGGIYGASGGRLLARVRRGELAPKQPVRYSNRIHRADCAGFLAHLLQRAAAGDALQPLYNAVDDDPAPQYEVEAWLARQLGVRPDPARVRDAAAGHKRCRNARLHASGFRLAYPDYRAGYGALLLDEAARS